VTTALVRLGLDSPKAREAGDILWAERTRVEAAIRRAMPTLARVKNGVRVQQPTPALLADVLDAVCGPHYASPLVVGGTGHGAFVLDGRAVALGIQSVLAGGKGEPPVLDPAGLSPAQRALASRLAGGLLAACREALASRGLAIEPRPGDEMPRGPLVAVRVLLGEGETPGEVVLLVPIAEVAAVARPPRPESKADAPSIDLAHVEIDVVVELGKAKLTLSHIGNLAVGDLVRVPLPLDAAARVRVGDKVLFRGRPTTSGHQIAIAIERHGD
jgi:flagellar motor switch/type III secretory pathway protein FliN